MKKEKKKIHAQYCSNNHDCTKSSGFAREKLNLTSRTPDTVIDSVTWHLIVFQPDFWGQLKISKFILG
jgi:hypothetical protein